MSNDTETLRLTDFLLARVAEDETRVDTIPEWHCTDSARGDGWGSRGNCPLCGQYMFDGTESVTKDAFWEHMEDDHQRTRVLADCEAKRRIVELHPPIEATIDMHPVCYGCSQTDDWPCENLRCLALPYADHPDFREEWRP